MEGRRTTVLKLDVRVFYEEQSRLLRIVGNGENTVKWLALVAAQRFVTDFAPRGRLRCRDRMPVLPLGTRLLPSEILTDEDTFHHPESKLIDEFQENEEIRVILEPKVKELDEIGEPKRSRWAIIAFTNSEHRQHKKTQALEEVNRLRDEKIRKNDEAAVKKFLEENRQKATMMRDLISHQLLSQDGLDLAMKREWEWMNRRGKMDKWCADKEKDRVVMKLKENFISLLELFRYYGASTTGANDAHLMEFVEFCSFCRDIQLFGNNNDVINHTSLSTCFAECAHIDSADVKKGHFEFGDFLASLVWLALTTKGGRSGGEALHHKDTNHDDKSQHSEGRRSETRELVDNARRAIDQRSRDFVGSQGSSFSLSVALQQLFDDSVAIAFRTHHAQLIGSITKENLAKDEVLALYYANRSDLEDIFRWYLTEKPEFFNMSDNYMSLQEFAVLLEDSKLVGGGDSDGFGLDQCCEIINSRRLHLLFSDPTFTFIFLIFCFSHLISFQNN